MSRLQELETQRCAGRLSPADARELDRLDFNEWQRRRRLPEQIERTRAKLEMLIEKLSPADQLRERRAEQKAAHERLAALEERLLPGLRLARIEAELGVGL